MRTLVLIKYLILLLSRLAGIVNLLQLKLLSFVLGSNFCRQNLQKGDVYICGHTDLYVIKQN